MTRKPRITEKQFQAQVVQLATLCGWHLIYHTFDSRRCAAGFPDLVLARGPGHAVRMVVAELKVGRNKPTPAQFAWLAAFEGAGVKAFVWTPEDWDEIQRTLQGG